MQLIIYIYTRIYIYLYILYTYRYMDKSSQPHCDVTGILVNKENHPKKYLQMSVL